jgi:hypothetical protein
MVGAVLKKYSCGSLVQPSALTLETWTDSPVVLSNVICVVAVPSGSAATV